MLEWQALGLHWMRRACGLAWQAETQKTGDSVFRSRAKSRNWVILRFACERRVENGWFCISSADDRQFLLYFSFRRPTTGSFFHFSIKNCDFSAPDAYFCKNGGRFCLPRPISAKNGGRFWLPDGPHSMNAWGILPLFHEHLQSSTHNFHTFIY